MTRLFSYASTYSNTFKIIIINNNKISSARFFFVIISLCLCWYIFIKVLWGSSTTSPSYWCIYVHIFWVCTYTYIYIYFLKISWASCNEILFYRVWIILTFEYRSLWSKYMLWICNELWDNVSKFVSNQKFNLKFTRCSSRAPSFSL